MTRPQMSFMDGMQISGDNYYKSNNLQDLWLTGENFNKEHLDKVKNIENVKNAERLLSIRTDWENEKEKDGVWFDSYLAKYLNLKVGDEISWHAFGNDNWYTCKIVGINRDPQNQNLNMTRKYYESLGLEYKADSLYTNYDLSDTKTIAGVETIQSISNLREGIESMLGTTKTMVVILIVVSVILAYVIIYNLGILSFAEKQYQFATLKVLGFKDKQIKKIFVKQNIWLSIVGILAGLPLGYIMIDYIFKAALGENYDFPAMISVPSYLYAAIGSFVVALVVNKILSRKVKTIDMVSSLKGNE